MPARPKNSWFNRQIVGALGALAVGAVACTGGTPYSAAPIVTTTTTPIATTTTTASTVLAVVPSTTPTTTTTAGRRPDGRHPARTPGATNPEVTQSSIHSTICVSGWTSTVRPPSSYTTSLKEQQLDSGYNIGGDTNPSDYEEDHFIPLELGGATRDPANLWPEPHDDIIAKPESSTTKDSEETSLKDAVCARTMTLVAAQSKIVADW